MPDLVAYQGPGTSYAGPTVAPLQRPGLVNTGASGGGPMDVFSVFDSLTVAVNGFGGAQGQVLSTGLSSPRYEALAPVVTGRTATNLLIAAGITFGPASNLSPAGLTPLPPAGVTITPVATGFMLQQAASSTAQPVVNAPAISEQFVLLQRTDHGNAPFPFLMRPRSGLVPDWVLDELTSDAVLVRGWMAVETGRVPVLPWDSVTDAPMPFDMAPRGTVFQPASEIRTVGTTRPQSESARQSAAPKVWLTDILFAIGFCGYGASTLSATGRRAANLHQKTKALKINSRPERH